MPKIISFFNTLTREVGELKPLESDKISLYCCGPTVYNFQHIGNLRTYIFEDLLARTIRFAGYKLNHVMNITDVGHLVSDADEGEDKMLVAAKREKKSSHEIAQYYTDIFFEHCSWLNIQRPDVVCKATEHITEMIELIQRLEDKGLAYQAGGNVYFDVQNFPRYGNLAKLDLEKLQAGARIEVDQQKKHPLDFALWFTKSKFENQELQWDSPWGRGYPGWHIECSAMSMKYCGETFDIHCGGIDHIPVHHTNEIAQSEGATDKPLSQFWLHGGFLLTDHEKMSKSKGEFLTLDAVKEKGFDPMSYRLFCLGASYRSELMFSWDNLQSAENTLKRIKKSVTEWKAENPEMGHSSNLAASLLAKFETAVFTDLGMPKALAVLHEVIQNKKLENSEKLSLLTQFDQVFGLGVAEWQAEETKDVNIPKEVLDLVEKREAARSNKDYAKADACRDEALALGFVIEDTPDGAQVKKA